MTLSKQLRLLLEYDLQYAYCLNGCCLTDCACFAEVQYIPTTGIMEIVVFLKH